MILLSKVFGKKSLLRTLSRFILLNKVVNKKCLIYTCRELERCKIYIRRNTVITIHKSVCIGTAEKEKSRKTE